jgi:hypothetical protein
LEKGVRGIDQKSNELRKNFVPVNEDGLFLKTQIIHPNFEIAHLFTKKRKSDENNFKLK